MGEGVGVLASGQDHLHCRKLRLLPDLDLESDDAKNMFNVWNEKGLKI